MLCCLGYSVLFNFARSSSWQDCVNCLVAWPMDGYGFVVQKFCCWISLLLIFSFSVLFLIFLLKARDCLWKGLHPIMTVTKAYKALFHQNTVSWICGHFRFAVFCRHLHLECMKFIRGAVLAANNWKLVKFQKKSFRSEGEIKADYLETLLDAKNYDNFVWVDVLSFPWLSSFEAKACPFGMNRNQCTMMAERSGLRSFPMKHNLLVAFFFVTPSSLSCSGNGGCLRREF